MCVIFTWVLPFWLQEGGVWEGPHLHLPNQGQTLQEKLLEPSCLRFLAPDLSGASPMTHCCAHKAIGDPTTLSHCLYFCEHAWYPPLCWGNGWYWLVWGGGWWLLLLFYGQLHQFLLTKETRTGSVSSINTTRDVVQNGSSISKKKKKGHYLYSIQHCFDDTGDRCHVLFILQVNAIQHHLVWPTDEVCQTLIHTAMARRQRRTVEKRWDIEDGQGCEVKQAIRKMQEKVREERNRWKVV